MYRENIYDVINATGERVSALLVPINRRLKAYTWKVLGEAGLKMDEAKQIAEDTLEVGGLKLVLRRGENIPQAIVEFARKGEVVLGITGDDLYDENRLQRPNSILRVENTYDWFDEAFLASASSVGPFLNGETTTRSLNLTISTILRPSSFKVFPV